MKNRSLAWFGWFNLVICTAAFLAMWGLYAQINPGIMADLSDYTNERWSTFAPVVSFPLVGALILHFRPRHSVGVVFAIVGLVNAIEFLATPYIIYSFRVLPEPLPFTSILSLLRNSIWVFQMAAFSVLPLIFPTGRPLSRPWWMLLFGVFVATSLMVGWVFVSSSVELGADPFVSKSPESEDPGWLISVAFYVLLLAVPLSLVSLIRRWRMARDLERLQIKWLLFGGLLAVVSLAFLIIPDILELPRWSLLLESAVSNLAFLALPTSVGIAILRYRLFDIDFIILRTLQYTLLTGLLALVYFGSVVLLQSLLENLTGRQSPVIIVVSTLAIAALFNPLRRRVQDFIDRRFFRKKYNAEQILANFAAITRDDVDMDKLTTALLDVVEKTMQPKHISLGLREQRVER